MMEPRIAIILSTYNGGEYIAEQLESILSQSYRNWKLYIRDDGSTDSTEDIINKYRIIDNRIYYLFDNIRHRGVKDSFIWSLKQVDGDYYMFCDQDDIWEIDKVKESYAAIANCDNNKPCIVCTDLSLVDQNLNLINKSMWKTHHLDKLVENPRGLIIASMFPGCSMLFNNEVRNLAINENYDFKLHDSLVAMVTYKNNGIIKAIHKPLIKYRLHSSNVVGLYSGNNWLLNKICTLTDTVRGIRNHYKTVNEYLHISFFTFIKLKISHLLNII